ncbi:hypothetical protein EMCRGX_G033267 [Ephydatia muelleri]
MNTSLYLARHQNRCVKTQHQDYTYSQQKLKFGASSVIVSFRIILRHNPGEDSRRNGSHEAGVKPSVNSFMTTDLGLVHAIASLDANCAKVLTAS